MLSKRLRIILLVGEGTKRVSYPPLGEGLHFQVPLLSSHIGLGWNVMEKTSSSLRSNWR